STSKTMAKQTLTVYINDQYMYFVDQTLVEEDQLPTAIAALIGPDTEASIVLRSDKTVPVQYVVNVIDAVNQLNEQTNAKHKVLLATSPKE
ncbi:MAG: biopolymer transporter ExbD, partial [Bacteroidales bacterium]